MFSPEKTRSRCWTLLPTVFEQRDRHVILPECFVIKCNVIKHAHFERSL